jgi:hypothetical protein
MQQIAMKIPTDLHRLVKVAAAQEGDTLKSLVIEGLCLVLIQRGWARKDLAKLKF